MNSVNMIGRLALDTKVGNGVATNLLAIKRIYKSADGEDSDFVPVSSFGKTAEVMRKYCAKGDRVGISGRIKTSTYQDKNGVTQHGFEVTVEHIFLLSNSKQSHEDNKTAITVTDNDLPF
ncbi:single-stranded DNA-binding protein [Lacticaseibacillus sp. 866-1]|uniref:single-stranded DNA-binding protein n=1 Tax=Lacticaseibacillus sp. 866-1 TaxID=2799576 RepID=UPI0019443197|nr:single-stranded DNA-binding protein [Lacticaseibacillus sp. 866-1]